MVYNYKRKGHRQSWDPGNMQKAIDAVKGGMAFLTAATTYKVPRNTLKRRVLEKNKRATGHKKVFGGFNSVFTKEQELEIFNHLLLLETRFFGMTVKDLRSAAYELAEKNKLCHTFNKESRMAGKGWIAGFRKRHQQLTLREPEQTSAARASGFNKISVKKFFDILVEERSKHNYTAHRIFNVDETGLTTVQSKSSKVLALRGRRQVGSLTSAERGVLCSLVMCMSAGGSYIPPYIIFPRLRMKAELTDGAPPGTAFTCHPSGWMQTELFVQWYNHFLVHAKPTKDDPVLLILDGHSTHTKNIEFIQLARANHTSVMCLPPHCTHKLQPLDVSFMGPLNTFYVQAIERFLRNNPGRTVTQYQVSRLFGEAYMKAAVPLNAVNGFRKCGIEPLNEHIFTEDEFAAAEVTDLPLPDGPTDLPTTGGLNSTDPLPSTSNAVPSLQAVSPSSYTTNLDEKYDPQPGTSFAISPKDIIPLPCVSDESRRRNWT
ncbi:MFS-type transporter clz9-like [Homalodisca vitripennis]|uniref:MFS-type transporter clz9-like n=1 Tax=Homalodisca vitripennis TaxID=197043 RepID=UPI001EE9D5BC|nr:MFS-type transporter clz9-like [Homalodisca vitripennis]